MLCLMACSRSTGSGILLDFKAAPDLDLIAQTGEVLGKQLQDVLPEELAGRIREALEDAFNTRETQYLNM